MKLKHFSVIFSLVGISLLYFISLLSKPIVIDLVNLSEYEGKQITTEGIVTNYYSTKYGSQLITIEDYNASATVFSEIYAEVEYGDRIRVTGEVQKYNDEWEIIVNDKHSISVIKKWENISMPLWQIAQNPQRYDGLNVNVTGFVDSVYDDYFYLADENDEHFLFVFYNAYENEKIYPGQKVNLRGLFKFDTENFRYILTTDGENHAIFPFNGE